jgi:hypothetical protein
VFLANAAVGGTGRVVRGAGSSHELSSDSQQSWTCGETAGAVGHQGGTGGVVSRTGWWLSGYQPPTTYVSMAGSKMRLQPLHWTFLPGGSWDLSDPLFPQLGQVIVGMDWVPLRPRRMRPRQGVTQACRPAPLGGVPAGEMRYVLGLLLVSLSIPYPGGNRPEG